LRIADLFRRKSVQLILEEASTHGKEFLSMKRNLKLWDLTSFGVAAIVGAGIFSTIGTAAVNGGAAVSLLFVFTAIACGLSAMCYAEFASAIPISGSAYTYAYASFGELIAWIIGWDLIMEYAIGNIAVAISWSGYFTGLLKGFGLDFPSWLTTDFLSAARGFKTGSLALQQGELFKNLPFELQNNYTAWTTAPKFFNIPIIADLPALFIVTIITWICYIGIRESKISNNIMVLLKIVILMLVIGVGSFYVHPQNWHPFAPNGIAGVLKGISGVFFAYIGFDAISTTAEECKNPKRDIPLSMFLSLLITTILYVVLCLVLTGMVSYKELGVDDPLAFVFARVHLNYLSGIIALGAVIAMASVMLVFQIGQPRIWMSMSRDGLLPPIFGKLHPKYRTPGFSTIVTGLFVAIPALFMNLTEVIDLTSIGTLFAFLLVSGGILKLNPRGERKKDTTGFIVPYFNSRYFLIPVWIIVVIIAGISMDTSFYLSKHFPFSDILNSLPFYIFLLATTFISGLAIFNQWSLIPVLGLITNFYLMSELGVANWLRFGIWLAVGLLIFFSYSIKKSKLVNT
jgi:amino acid transporter